MRLLILIALFIAAPAHAATFDVLGRIKSVGTADPSLWGPFDYLLLDDLGAGAGNCARDRGFLLVVLPHAQAYAAALSAQATGANVTMSLDDTRTDSGGYCILRWMRVEN